MAIVNTWNVVALDAYPTADGEVDVVCNVHWTLTGVEDEFTGSVYGSQAVTLDAEAPFIPYADLTLETVIGWVKEAMGAEQVAAVEENVAKQIAEAKKPSIITPPLPWVALGPTPFEETAA